MFFSSCVFCSLSLFKIKTEGQAIDKENLTEELQTQIKILANLRLT